MAVKLEDLTPEQLALYNATPDISDDEIDSSDIPDTDFSDGIQLIDPTLSAPERAAALADAVIARRERRLRRVESETPPVGVVDGIQRSAD